MPIASTNSLERAKKDIKRRSHVIRTFTNDAAIVRLAGALLDEQTDIRQVSRRYMGRGSSSPNNPQPLLEARKAA